MTTYATVDDVIRLGRTLTPEEEEKASALLESAAAMIRKKAVLHGKEDFDAVLSEDEDLQSIAREVSVRAVLRALNSSTTMEAATTITETAGPYSQSFAPLMPGGGVYIRKSEWEMLGLSGQLVRNVELI